MNSTLGPLLRDVSRTFYRTLHVLPVAIRSPISLAYLLARGTDTIADTEWVPVEERLTALDALRDRVLGCSQQHLDFHRFQTAAPPPQRGSAAEQQLLLRIEEAITLLDSLSTPDRQDVREVLQTITSGQRLDLLRFRGASEQCIFSLPNADALHDYTYRVAGCVGGFWTRVCQRNLFHDRPVGDGTWFGNGIRFGRGLQLVNILRDLPSDLRMGRCYLPANELAEVGLRASELLDPAQEPRLRPVYNRWLDLAESHLQAGWRYTCALPHRQARLRLSCAWPVLIGLQTTSLLRGRRILDPTNRIKISRRDVRQIMLRTLWRLPFPQLWRSLA